MIIDTMKKNKEPQNEGERWITKIDLY